MSDAARPLPRLAAWILATAAVALHGGCLVYQAVTAPIKLAGTAVVVTAETAGTVITTSGKVIRTVVSSGGSVATQSVESSAQLARRGMVTFADNADGSIVRVPWAQGLTLAGAGEAAQVKVGGRALEIIRNGKLAYEASRAPGEKITLRSGDVVRMIGER